MPSNDRLIEMTNTAIYDLALAINARDFTAFHEKISKLWQSQITTDELFNAFKGFSDNNIDLTVLKDIEPVFSQPPSIDDNDILVLDGYYPSEPPIAYFNLKYIYEYPDWKLFGIHVNMK